MNEEWTVTGMQPAMPVCFRQNGCKKFTLADNTVVFVKCAEHEIVAR